MFTLKIALAVGLLSFLTNLAIAPENRSETSRANQICTPEFLVGRYMIIGGEKEGTKEPDERIKGTTVVFTKQTIVVTDKDKNETYSASYKLDSTTNPCNITMSSRVKASAGEIVRGLIKQEGETLQLVYALPTGEIPAAFKTKEKQLMFVMKRIE